jgi:hypothetical protein
MFATKVLGVVATGLIAEVGVELRLPTLPRTQRNREEEPVAAGSTTIHYLYNGVNLNDSPYPLPANSTGRLFQIRLNQDSWKRADLFFPLLPYMSDSLGC